MGYYGSYFPKYIPVSQRRRNAEKAAKKLSKKSGVLQPVVIEGRTIASSWWGKSWNENLERYADYAYRIDRGRAYVRNGMVVDLKIEKGVIHAIVAGSRSEPYSISITIKPLDQKIWNRLVKKTSGSIGSMQTLLEGKFPEELKDLFFSKNEGLFPKPSEISMECSCPDWAVMCKHVAAALYGVGNRLDTSAHLFFTLRGVNVDELITEVAQLETKKLLKAKITSVKSKRILKKSDIPDADMSALFGISLESNTTESDSQPLQSKKTSQASSPRKTSVSRTSKKIPKERVQKSSPSKKNPVQKKEVKKTRLRKTMKKK